MEKYKIAMLLFPDLTIQDFVGPYDVFVRAGCFEVFIVSDTTEPMQAEGGLVLQASLSLDACPAADILFVPGGRGINPLLTNPRYLDFIRRQGSQAKYITSVCTGALVLAAAGLLRGYKATTHWRSLEPLTMLSVEAVDERIVVDRNRITGGGITAGIDFGLLLTSIVAGDQVAKTVQLLLEYNPQPPFNSGSTETASSETLAKAKALTQTSFDERVKIITQLLNDPSKNR